MAKQVADLYTLELPGFTNPPGRPRSPQALSGAQRQARYRAKSLERQEARKGRFSHLSDVTLCRYMAQAAEEGRLEDSKDLYLEFGRRMGFR